MISLSGKWVTDVAEKLNEEIFAGFIAGSTLPVLVDFYQDGCVPCRRVAPLLSKAETEYDGKITVARVNLAQNLELAEQYGIAAAPTLLLFRDGKEIARHRGVIDREGLKAFVEAVCDFLPA